MAVELNPSFIAKFFTNNYRQQYPSIPWVTIFVNIVDIETGPADFGISSSECKILAYKSIDDLCRDNKAKFFRLILDNIDLFPIGTDIISNRLEQVISLSNNIIQLAFDSKNTANAFSQCINAQITEVRKLSPVTVPTAVSSIKDPGFFYSSITPIVVSPVTTKIIPSSVEAAKNDQLRQIDERIQPTKKTINSLELLLDRIKVDLFEEKEQIRKYEMLSRRINIIIDTLEKYNRAANLVMRYNQAVKNSSGEEKELNRDKLNRAIQARNSLAMKVKSEGGSLNQTSEKYQNTIGKNTVEINRSRKTIESLLIKKESTTREINRTKLEHANLVRARERLVLS